jgi:phage FluMu gp28-like protein
MLDTDLLEFADIPEDIDALPHWIGMDVGSTSDRTAIVDLAQLKDGNYFVRDIVMMNKASYESQLNIVKQKNEKLKYKGGFIDANGIGSALSEFASKQVSAKIRPFTWTSANKTPAYEDMRALVFDHKLKFASHLEQLVKQDIRNVHRLVNEAGKVSYSAGRDANGHSDATSAIVLAIQASKQFPNQIATPQAYGRQSAFGGYDPRMWG